MKYSVEVWKAVDEIYNLVNANSAEASRQLSKKGIEITPGAIRYQWRKNEKPLAQKGGRRHGCNKEDIQIIIRAYKTYNGSSYRAAKELPYSETTFIKFWRQNNLQIRQRGDRGPDISSRKKSSLDMLCGDEETINERDIHESDDCDDYEMFATSSEFNNVRDLFL